MFAAPDDAGMKPTDIDYINTHGTATPGWYCRGSAIVDVLENTHNMNISATKSMICHHWAAGVGSAIALHQKRYTRGSATYNQSF